MLSFTKSRLAGKNLSFLFIAILILSSKNLYSQHERLESLPKEERVLNDFSKSAIMDSTELDSIIINTMETYHIPGLAALINTKEDGIIWKRNYGYANIEFNRPVMDTTLFLMASISKTIVATAIMQFWEADSFDLDDNINDYLDNFQVTHPNYPNDTITFRMLMTHTSSINDNWSILTPLVTCGDSPIPLDSFLVNYFTPGGIYYSQANFNYWSPTSNTYDYSNVGIALLAYVVERFSGTSFDEYCRESIFNQLEMDKTSWFLEGLDRTTIATPYKWQGGQYVANCHQGWPLFPIGFLRTNKIELEHFLSTYMNWGQYNGETILDSSTIDLMLSDHLGYISPDGDIQGLIWYQRGPLNDRWPWGHEGGWTSGTRTAMFFQQDENWGVIYFMNMYYSYASPVHLFILNTLCDYAQDIYVGVDEVSYVITDFYLEQNYPNPFNPTTTIRYQIPELSFVTLKVYDVLGSEVATLVNEERPVGNYEVEFNAANLSSGVYFYRFQAGSFVETKKMLMIK